MSPRSLAITDRQRLHVAYDAGPEDTLSSSNTWQSLAMSRIIYAASMDSAHPLT